MFTGIIQAVVPVLSVTSIAKGVRVKLAKPVGFRMQLGESVAVDGICLTVVSFRPKFFEVELMPETLSKTTTQEWGKGRKVNVEQSLRVGQKVDGHFVQGHIDRVETVKNVNKEGERYEMELSFSKDLRPFVALHGSITINGVSLTVMRLTNTRFSVALIPFTLKHTNLGALHQGEKVNIEVDSLARIVVGALEHYQPLYPITKKPYARK